LEYILKWDISIPEDWQYGEWDRISLFPVDVPMPIIRCEECGKYFRVKPGFIIKGTILTVNALVFVAFAYECKNSGLTWRMIADKFCKDGEKISHSTLYTAVHKLGKLVIESELFQKLCSSIPTLSKDMDIERQWPVLKSRYPHTQKREKAVLTILYLFMMLLIANERNFLSILSRYAEVLQGLLKSHRYSLPKLYGNTS
jgi:hypothetical protein